MKPMTATWTPCHPRAEDRSSATIRHERVITALIRAALALPIGIFLAALGTQALAKYDVCMSVPIPTLAASHNAIALRAEAGVSASARLTLATDEEHPRAEDRPVVAFA